MTVVPTFLKRIGWMVAIWITSVLALGVVAGLLKLLLSSPTLRGESLP